MKPKNDIFLIIGFVALIALVVFIGLSKEAYDRKEIKALKENVDKVVNYDSIMSAMEKRILDSVKVLRTSLEQIKQEQRNENKRLRKQNQELERRFRDLDISDRPDF